MEDSNAMTIEFLRARLLSERSVSRTAKQRADELAKRVFELEEQLKIVSLQRKRAEKAAEDVLAILENNGVSDTSEEFESSSEQDVHCESKEDNSFTKEEESSINSKVRGKELDEPSNSILNFPPASGRSLSWNGCRSVSRSPEKHKGSITRRRSNFGSVGFSSHKHRQGKSCRQIRHQVSRSAVEEYQKDDVKIESPIDEPITSSESNTNHSVGGPHILTVDLDSCVVKGPSDNLHSASIEEEKNAMHSELRFHKYEGGKEMEKALEHQAQLIDRYEAMERAQREWEEKFRENNNSTPDSFDHGNHSDITEEQDEVKVEALDVDGMTVSAVEDEEASHVRQSRDISITHPDNSLEPSHGNMDGLPNQRCGSSPAGEYPEIKPHIEDVAFPNEKKDHSPGSLPSTTSPVSNHKEHLQDLLGDQPSSGREASVFPNDCKSLVPHEKSTEFTCVLDALKRAKLSLQQKINKLPLVDSGSVGKATEASSPATRVSERLEIPVGCAGLFRVPTDDFSVETTSAKLLCSDSILGLGNNYLDREIACAASSRAFTSPYMNTRWGISSDHQLIAGERLLSHSCIDTKSSPSHVSNAFDQYISNPYLDVRSSFSTIPTVNAPSAQIIGDRHLNGNHVDAGMSREKPHFDPYMDPRLPSSSLYNHPTFPPYMNRVPHLPTQEVLSDIHTSKSVGASLDQFSFYNNHSSPNMYR